jgi:UDP-glucose 4-epimerase
METKFVGISVLITGSTGFIGSHLTRALVLRGARAHLVVRPNTTPWRIHDLLDRVTLHYADILDYKALLQIAKNVNPIKVFHLASMVNAERRFDLLTEMVKVNIQGTANLLLALQDTPIDCVINTGTCEEYGINQAPFVENQREKPVSPYSVTKVASTHIAQMMYRVSNFPVITVRPFLTYGPAQKDNMFIPALIKAALSGKQFDMTSGEQTREFNYVSDIVDGYLKAATTPSALGEVINLGNGVEYKISKVANLIMKLAGKTINLNLGALPYRPGEVMHFYSQPKKAMELLQWKPKINLKQGLIRTIEWYKKYWSMNNV